MADIQIEVGLDEKKSYTEVKRGINNIEKELREHPIKIKAGILKGETTDLIGKDLKSIVKSLNKAPIKLKAQLDKRSLNTIAKQMRSALAVELKDIIGDANNGGAKNNSGVNNNSGVKSSSQILSPNTKQYLNAVRQMNKKIGDVERASLSYDKFKDGNTSTYYNSLIANLKQLQGLRAKLAAGDLSSSAFTREFSHIELSVGEAIESLKTFDHELKVHEKNMKASAKSTDVLTADTKEYSAALLKIDKALIQTQGKLRAWTAAAKSNSVSENYKGLEQGVKDYTKIRELIVGGKVTKKQFNDWFGATSNEVLEHSTKIKNAGKNMKTFGERIGGMSSKMMSFMSIAQVFNYATIYAKKMFEESVKIESAMNQIQIVTGASDKQMTSFLEKSIALAKELGQSVTDVASSIETFTRLGYNMSDASNLSKYANIMSNVAATDIDTATTGITSIIKGYQLDPDDAEHVADVLVKVGQDYAISAEELMAAFQRGGAALYASGTDFEKSAALFAATNASLQNAETTGTLWKSVSARIRSAKTELEEMGEDTSDLAEGFSKYREEIKALSGVDIMKDEHTFKDMYDIFVQLASVWDKMQDTSQARVAEILGGKRNTSGIISTIVNIKDATGAYEKAMNSANVATKANALYMDTTKAKIGELKASFQEFATDVLSSDLTKFAVGSLSNIIEAVDHLIDKFGTLSVTLAGIGIYKKIKDVFVVSKDKGGIKSGSDLISNFLLASPKLDKAVTNMKAAISKSTGAFGKFTAGASAFVGSFSPISLVITSTIALIGGLALAINHANEKIKEQVEKARESGDAWNDSNSSIDNYKSRMEELRNQLNSGNLTEQESYKVKSELLSIQQSLTDSYGEQASGIDLVNGSLSTQISKLEQLKKVEAERYINENVEGNEHAYNEMTKSRRYSVGTYSKYMSDDAKGAIDNILSKLNAKYDGAFTQINGLEDLNIVFDGDATKAEQALNEFMTEVRNSSKELEDEHLFDGILSSAGESLSKNKKVLEEYQDVYKNFLMAKITTDSSSYASSNGMSQTPSQWLSEYASSVEKYNNALMSGDSSEISKARQEFEMMEKAINLLISGDLREYSQLFEEVGNQLNTASANVEKFREATENTPSFKKAADALKQLSFDDNDFMQAATTNGTQAGEAHINKLIDAALEAGVISDKSSESLRHLADVLVDIGIVSGEPADKFQNIADSLGIMKTRTDAIVGSLSNVQGVLNSQKGGSTAAISSLNQDELKSYAKAIELVNGTMQLNAEKVREISEAKVEEQIALNNTNKAMEQAKYLDNAKKIEQYRQKLREASFSENETAESVKASINVLLSENSAIADNCAQYDMLSASLREAVDAYHHWLNAQSASDYGDMANDAVSAIQRINDTYKDGTSVSGNFGSKKFAAALDFIVPDSVDKEDLSAVESYMSSFNQYLRFDDKGAVEGLNVDKFLENAVNAGLMSYSDDEGFKILGNKKMEDFAEGLNLSSGAVQAFFDELQLKGGKFDWSDEAVKTIGDLAVEANEAAEALRGLDTENPLKIKMDVSDLSTTEEQLSALDDTIAEMDGVKARFGVDSSEAEHANAVIQYCLTQKQLLSQPDVMRVDTSKVQGDLGEAIALLQEFQRAQNELEIQSKIGADTSEAKAKVDSLAAEIQKISPEIKANLGLDTTSVEQLSSSIAGLTADTLVVKAGVDDSAVVGYQPETKNCEVVYSPKTDALPKSFDAINRVVNYTSDTSGLPTSFTTLTRYVNYVATGDTKGGMHELNGTAHAGGTALIGGDWGTAPGGKTLVGELGREIVVDPRTGRWYTVGDNGAEFRNIPHGAIVFNHRQTEELLANGYVSGRASALVSGTAMVTGGIKPYKPNSFHSSSSGRRKSRKSNGSSSSKAKEFEEIIDFIEIAIDRATEAFNRLAIVAESAFKTLTTRNKALNNEIENLTSRIELHTKAYEGYMAKANSIGLSEHWAKKVRDGSIEITTITDEDLSKKIKEYKDYYEKAIKVKDEIEQLNEDIAKIYQSKFENISKDFENQLELLEHMTNTYNQGIDDLEERGYLASTSYYKALQKVEQQNIEIQKKELSALVQAMSDAVNSGKIQEGSEAWYEMQSSINGVKESIQESETEIVKFQNAIREIEWDRFDYLQERISSITSEADFMIKLMDSSKLFDDKGKFTDTGMATTGLHGQNYNVYMAQADKYAQEVKRLNAEIANDPNNTKLLERREELIEAQRDSILAAEDEKLAIRDLVEEGIKIELESLEKLIDKYLDALDTAKDLYDYQQKVEEQAADIARIQKQLSAYSGDNSEEAKATIQKLQVELKDAQKNLEETQYDRFISEQKALLDQLYSEYELVLNSRLDNVDALMSEMIDSINASSSNIKDTLVSQGDKVGYDLSEAMHAIWSDSGNAGSIITKYGDSFTTLLTSVNNVLNNIAQNVTEMVHGSDSAADKVVEETKPVTKPTAPPPAPPAPPAKPTTPTPPSTQSNGRSDTDYYGVALAIANGGYGWGNGSTRTNRLREKGFDSSRVQSIVNQLFREGHIRNGSWVGRYKGIRSLAPYHYNKYKNGGLIDYTGIAQVDGTPSKPEVVLNAKDSQNFMALRDIMKGISDKTNPLSLLFDEDATSKMMKNLAEVTTPRTNDNASIGEITYHVNIPIEHVQDYNDFMNQMKKDGKFENMIRSMTVDQLSGGSHLSKNKFKW